MFKDLEHNKELEDSPKNCWDGLGGKADDFCYINMKNAASHNF